MRELMQSEEEKQEEETREDGKRSAEWYREEIGSNGSN